MAKSTATSHTATFDPMALAIMGGLDALPERERGPLDTATDKSSPLYDERLKAVKLSSEWISNIKTRGVREMPNVVMLGDVPFVVNGRQRVRAARVANLQLAEEKAPLITITANVVKLDDLDMLRDMVALNIHHEDAVSIKIAKLKRLIERGVTVEEAATLFATRPATVKAWIQYDETAIPAVKKAVNAGKIPQTTGAEIARLPQDKQQKALDGVLASAVTTKEGRKERTGSAAKAKRVIARAGGKATSISDKKTLKRFLEAVESIQHPKSTKGEMLMWWAGVESALHMVLGGDGQDEKLVAILATLDDAANVPGAVDMGGAPADDDDSDEE